MVLLYAAAVCTQPHRTSSMWVGWWVSVLACVCLCLSACVFLCLYVYHLDVSVCSLWDCNIKVLVPLSQRKPWGRIPRFINDLKQRWYQVNQRGNILVLVVLQRFFTVTPIFWIQLHQGQRNWYWRYSTTVTLRINKFPAVVASSFIKVAEQMEMWGSQTTTMPSAGQHGPAKQLRSLALGTLPDPNQLVQ